jgi:hypothetical protein
MSKSEQIEGYVVVRFPLSLMEISVSLNEVYNYERMLWLSNPHYTTATRKCNGNFRLFEARLYVP